MRKLAFLPLIALVLSCSDSTLVQPPIETELAVTQASAKGLAEGQRTQYAIQFVQDAFCTDCDPMEMWMTPSMIVHFGNGTNGFFLTGELEGYALISAGTNGAMANFRNGKAVGSGILHVDLTVPKVGAFDCHWHAQWENYAPPFDTYVEYGKWFNCKGSGGFEGERMVLWNDNSATPGLPLNTGIAEIW